MKIKRISDATVRGFKMRLMHISDTHGGFPRLYGKFDCVVHSGDFFPNSHHVRIGEKVKEADFQMQWLKDNVKDLKLQLQGHPFIFVLGNHDFLDPKIMEQFLISEGINAINISEKQVKINEVVFYGFPFIPEIGGNMWNYEKSVPEMQLLADDMFDAINKNNTDVLVCHAPMHNCLDLSYGNELLGSTVLANYMAYKVKPDMMPSAYLCGHIHEAHGLTIRNGMLVSNAATTQSIIEV